MEINAQLDEETIRKLQQIQQQTNQDQAEILKAAIAVYYDRLQPSENHSPDQSSSNPSGKSPQTTFKSALDIFEESGFIGCIDSGESSISENHREIVSDIIRRKFERSREP